MLKGTTTNQGSETVFGLTVNRERCQAHCCDSTSVEAAAGDHSSRLTQQTPGSYESFGQRLRSYERPLRQGMCIACSSSSTLALELYELASLVLIRVSRHCCACAAVGGEQQQARSWRATVPEVPAGGLLGSAAAVVCMCACMHSCSQGYVCLQTGHWTYECKGQAAYLARPSASKTLVNPVSCLSKFCLAIMQQHAAACMLILWQMQHDPYLPLYMLSLGVPGSLLRLAALCCLCARWYWITSTHNVWQHAASLLLHRCRCCAWAVMHLAPAGQAQVPEP